MERENWAYFNLDEYQRHEGVYISPKVLGQLTECGRVIGLLMERQEGRFASIEDLPECAATVRKLHEIGLVHGDVNRYNFVINEEKGNVALIDFEHAEEFSEEAAKKALESLESELNEETGRGGPAIIWEETTDDDHGHTEPLNL
jgi:serine/threonine protein kinase